MDLRRAQFKISALEAKVAKAAAQHVRLWLLPDTRTVAPTVWCACRRLNWNPGRKRYGTRSNS